MNQFLEDQKKFQEKVNKKKEELKLETQDQVYSGPAIDEGSKKIIEEKMGERKNKPTYERLYEMNKEKKIKEENSASQNKEKEKT